MLQQTGSFAAHGAVTERAMDSGDLEKERGITILAKNAAVTYAGPHAGGKEITINVIDTPGHADFGGEVEGGLSMVDGVVLLVDASEGPLPQTRFVLRKALAAKLPVILVVNKTDRPDSRIDDVVRETQDLLLGLASDLADEVPDVDVHSLLDLPIIYASGRAGAADPIPTHAAHNSARSADRSRQVTHRPVGADASGAIAQATPVLGQTGARVFFTAECEQHLNLWLFGHHCGAIHDFWCRWPA